MWEHKWIDAHLLSTLPLLKLPRPLMKIRFPVSGGTKWDVSYVGIDKQGNRVKHEYRVEIANAR